MRWFASALAVLFRDKSLVTGYLYPGTENLGATALERGAGGVDFSFGLSIFTDRNQFFVV